MKISQQRMVASEFVEDVRIGMSDEALQRKYAISQKKFYLYKATALDIIAKQKTQGSSSKIKLNAAQFLDDIRSGMDDETLMLKYNLIQRHLQTAFRKIIEKGLITPLELCNRLKVTKSQVREAFLEMGKAIRELD
jgi:type IV secretory pathway TrbF-like protein